MDILLLNNIWVDCSKSTFFCVIMSVIVEVLGMKNTGLKRGYLELQDYRDDYPLIYESEKENLLGKMGLDM